MKLMPHIVFFFLCWSSSFQICNAAAPTTEAVGKLLGYPSSELLIEDTTVQERIIINTPSRREHKRQLVLPDPAILLEAYLIRGKNGSSFFPLQIYISAKGAFLTPEVLDDLAKSDEMPVNRRAFTPQGFASIGKGGSYFTPYHKIKSDILPVKTPGLVAAAIYVVQPCGQEFDIKIAWRAGLDQDQELQLIPGGEAYYNTFGPSSDQKAEPRLDDARIILELNKIVIAEWLAKKGSHGIGPPAQPLSNQQTTPSKPPVVAPQTEPLSTPSSSALRWWLGGLALVVLAFIANAVRKRRS
jgi:hypothetical protein